MKRKRKESTMEKKGKGGEESEVGRENKSRAWRKTRKTPGGLKSASQSFLRNLRRGRVAGLTEMAPGCRGCDGQFALEVAQRRGLLRGPHSWEYRVGPSQGEVPRQPKMGEVVHVSV